MDFRTVSRSEGPAPYLQQKFAISLYWDLFRLHWGLKKYSAAKTLLNLTAFSAKFISLGKSLGGLKRFILASGDSDLVTKFASSFLLNSFEISNDFHGHFYQNNFRLSLYAEIFNEVWQQWFCSIGAINVFWQPNL